MNPEMEPEGPRPEHPGNPGLPEPGQHGSAARVTGAARAGSRSGTRNQLVGAAGEDLATRWYIDNGYEILDRNWRRREGEVDLIARKGRTVVFCEVKSRSSDRFGTGAESVVPAKQRRIRRLADRWLSELTPASGRSRVEIRFDVVGVNGGILEVIEDAF